MHLHKIITIISMDRQIPVCNRVVDKKMQEFRSRKHRQTLSQIKNKSNSSFYTTMYQQTPNLNRYSSAFLQNKNLEIERENIKLFNKIASIIREKPKAVITQSSSYAQSCTAASSKHKKRQQRIKTQNESKHKDYKVLQKRISEQKPTIQNKQFFKDRMKNVKYLKLIGRYPYQATKRSQSAEKPNDQNSTMRTTDQISTDIQVYRKRTESFFVRINRIPNNYYIFNVEVQGRDRNYQYIMKKACFDEQFMRCGYNYDKLIGQLRLNQEQQIKFQYFPLQENNLTE